jgi:hypothetical protein
MPLTEQTGAGLRWFALKDARIAIASNPLLSAEYALSSTLSAKESHRIRWLSGKCLEKREGRPVPPLHC